jgi:hypothetical protein
MKHITFLKCARVLAPVLIASLLVSCTASQLAGVANIQRPPLTETNENTWFAYWEDQLDAFEGRVLAPALEYPPVAKSAYARAVQDWNMKAADAKTKTVLVWTAAGIAVPVILLLVVIK